MVNGKNLVRYNTISIYLFEKYTIFSSHFIIGYQCQNEIIMHSLGARTVYYVFPCFSKLTLFIPTTNFNQEIILFRVGISVHP